MLVRRGMVAQKLQTRVVVRKRLHALNEGRTDLREKTSSYTHWDWHPIGMLTTSRDHLTYETF